MRLLVMRLRARLSTCRNSFLVSSVAIECRPSSPMALPDRSISTRRVPRESNEAIEAAPSGRSRQSESVSISMPAPSMRAPRATNAAPHAPRHEPLIESVLKAPRLVHSSMQKSARLGHTRPATRHTRV